MEEKFLPLFPNISEAKQFFKSTKKNVIFLISCSKLKQNSPGTAEFVYSKSPLFRKQKLVAEKIVGKKNVFVLSAKYGIIPLNKKIKPYDVTLKNKSKREKQKWGEKVVKQMTNIWGDDLKHKIFVILAGKDYYYPLISNEIFSDKIFIFYPKSFGNGKRLQYLNLLIKK